MKNIFIPILLGTSRIGNTSEHVAQFIFEEVKKLNKFETELIKVSDFVSSPKTESSMTKDAHEIWHNTMIKADGLIIVSPEYNHGYPGELKLMLDELYKEYNFKPLGIVGVSSGAFGGARGIEALRHVASELKMVSLRNMLYFPTAQKILETNNQAYKDGYKAKFDEFFNELLWYAETLKSKRPVNN